MSDPVKRNLIGGEWLTGRSVVENRSPSDLDDVVGTYAQADAGQVAAAIDAAAEAAPGWSYFSSQRRAELLDRVGQRLLDRRTELGTLLSREEGKTLNEGIGEVARAGNIFKFFSGEALRTTGTCVESVRAGVDVEMRREALGVVGLITPWNFPIAIPAWKIAPALAYGNTVVMKPADLVPASVHALAEILVECGCPPGVFNLVMGRGSVIGPSLVNDARVMALSFTGSVGTGQNLLRGAAERNLKLQLEMGGKNGTIVLADADLEVAVRACIEAAFLSTGQRCTATSRVIVERKIRAEFTERFLRGADALRVGHALDKETQVGPVASESQLRTNLEYVAIAAKEGAQVHGGEVLERPTKGYFQRPAVFLEARNDMRSSREEIFGPCASVIEAGDLDEALALLNDSPFGLSAGICTTSLKNAREFTRRAKAGMTMVNVPTAGVDFHVPFGGTKGSSHGPREQGHQAIEFYTTMKTSYTLA